MSTIPYIPLKHRYRISSEQHMVHIGDPTTSDLVAMMHFIEDAGLNLVSVEDLDVSDVTMQYDILRIYTFAKEEDAMIFTLKFKGTTGNG